MTGNRFVWVPFWILVLLMIGGTMLIDNVKAEYDCLDYALESGEPVMLIGKHPYFYGSTSINHFVNYKQIDNRTFEIYDYMYGSIYKTCYKYNHCEESFKKQIVLQKISII